MDERKVIYYIDNDERYMALFMRKIQIIALVFLILFINFAGSLKVNAEDEPAQLYSKSCALMDGESGRVLFGKEEMEPRANASTTKILTCIVALENGELEGNVKVSSNAAGQPKVHLGMRKDEEFCLKDLLYGLMLESFNDCAVAIAEHISGTTEDFARLMNDKAKEIGCEETYFITPNGLDAQDKNGIHHTTAKDLCRIMKYCCWESPKSEEFLHITETPSYSFQDTKGKSFSCSNHNAFLTMMDGVISGKTGFTGDAGYCYVAALERDGRKYCIALLACGWPNNRTYKWSDAKKLLGYGLDAYQKKNIFQMPKLEDVIVRDGKRIGEGLESWGKTVSIHPAADCTDKTEMYYLISENDQTSVKLIMNSDISAPIQEGTKIGRIQVILNNEIIKEYPVTADEKLEKWTFMRLLRCILEEYLCQ